MNTVAWPLVVLAYAVCTLTAAAWLRRYRGADGADAICLGLSWPLIPLALAIIGIGALLEKLVRVKK